MQILFLCAALLSLTACTKIVPYYKPDIQQGNVLTTAQLQQLKPGMSKAQVIELLGNPVLNNSLNDTQLIYLYTNQPNRQPYVEHKLILSFANQQLRSIEGNYPGMPDSLR